MAQAMPFRTGCADFSLDVNMWASNGTGYAISHRLCGFTQVVPFHTGYTNFNPTKGFKAEDGTGYAET